MTQKPKVMQSSCLFVACVCVLRIVVEVTGDSISRENAQMLANILQENAHLLVIQVNTVQPRTCIHIYVASYFTAALLCLTEMVV